MNKIIKRRFTVNSNISSDASGVVVLTATGAADIITLLGTEFSNFSQEFSEYRVLTVGVHIFPSTTNATSSTGPYQGGILLAPWAQLKPTTLDNVRQSDSLVKFSTLEEKNVRIMAPNGPNFKLWTGTSTALALDRDFGFTWVSVGTLAVTSRIFTALFELEVEFRLPV